jgi:hypothetical protein
LYRYVTGKSPDGKLSFAAYVAAVRETVDYEEEPECPGPFTALGGSVHVESYFTHSLQAPGINP